MKKALIYGAGAIGRGFLAPHIKNDFKIDFVETNPNIIKHLKQRNEYSTAISNHKHYEYERVFYDNVFNKETIDFSSYDAIFLSVGCGNCLNLSEKLNSAKNIFVLENDKDLTNKIKKTYKNERVYFVIPDVITSNSAPQELLEKDSMCLVSEKGRLIVENGDYNFFHENKVSKKELDMHWYCKFFIHNAPHAITAYLGSMKDYKYIHESMSDTSICNIIESTMGSITKAIIKTGMIPESMGHFYMQNELKRFKDKLLYDPIKRVARDPLRKLDKNNRLIKSLRMIENAQMDTSIICYGINAAINYMGPVNIESVLKNTCNIHEKNLIKKIKNSKPQYILDNNNLKYIN
jgi:mannitol-1-phosphate 5-dehydrogenase